jgi:hypothetical protein
VFCPQCGTPIYAAAPENPPQVSIRLGCVTQRAALAPALQVWRRSAQPWLARLQDIPGSPEQQAMTAAPPQQPAPRR